MADVTTVAQQQPTAAAAVERDPAMTAPGAPQASGGGDGVGIGDGDGDGDAKTTAEPHPAPAGADEKPAADDTEHAHDKSKPSGGYDDTPVPHTDGPGFTVRFTIHRARNLPVADLSSSSSDPFVHITLSTDVPTRHKEDPPMVHRTHTVHRTTEPVWDEDWIVANIPASGFRIKCRLYDEDAADHDDRLGNVTYAADHVDLDYHLDHAVFDVKKRMGSKRAYLLKAATATLTGGSITATLELSVQVLGRSEPPGGRVYTVGPTTYVRHFSPMIGRLTKTLVNKDETQDEGGEGDERSSSDKQTKKYDFQANEIQLQGPTPDQLYHRYVEFRPIIGRMFASHGLRGRILNKALHKQHNRVYNFGRTTEYGTFPPCSPQAALQFLKLVHFDEGGRIFTYMISLDGVFRFTETGKEFGIDMLSKHTMHSDVATYIAFSGEFFVRRLARPTSAASSPEPPVPTHPAEPVPGGPPDSPPPHEPGYYQLIIDNDSGTYRPNKALLPVLKAYLEKQFPGLGIVALHWEDERLQAMKRDQHAVKKREGPGIQMVLNRSPTNSSFSSSDESRLSDMGRNGDDDDEHDGHHGKKKTKKEMAWELLEDPSRIKDLHSAMHKHSISDASKKG